MVLATSISRGDVVYSTVAVGLSLLALLRSTFTVKTLWLRLLVSFIAVLPTVLLAMPWSISRCMLSGEVTTISCRCRFFKNHLCRNGTLQWLISLFDLTDERKWGYRKLKKQTQWLPGRGGGVTAGLLGWAGLGCVGSSSVGGQADDVVLWLKTCGEKVEVLSTKYMSPHELRLNV